MTTGQRIEVAPEPPPAQAEAIARALRVPRAGDHGPGAWWRAGVEESVLEDACYAAARPRRRRGAERA